MTVDKNAAGQAIAALLDAIVESPDIRGTIKTPERVADMYGELLAGYDVDPIRLLNGALYDVEYDGMVVVRNIEFFSLCEHHLLPFYGVVHIGYIPDEKVVGLSKLSRFVDMFAKRLQIQERMTKQITEVIWELVKPKGVGVIVEGQHFCMAMRGISKTNTTMITDSAMGEFELEAIE